MADFVDNHANESIFDSSRVGDRGLGGGFILPLGIRAFGFFPWLGSIAVECDHRIFHAATLPSID